MFKHSIVLMTALVPTIGHQSLINFASHVSEKVTVIVSERSFEPTSGYHRIKALRESSPVSVSFMLHSDDDAPQNDDGTDEFWNYWTSLVPEGVDCVVASENYGKVFADRLGVSFMPYDLSRTIEPLWGSYVRGSLFTDPDKMFPKVVPGFRKLLAQHFVLFGQESVGKTTIMNDMMHSDWGGQHTFHPEWARGYLESVGPELSQEKMENIVLGQSSLEVNSWMNPKTLINIYDTDLLSTIGYYRIGGFEGEENINLINKSHYFLLPDDVPFVEDQLRYGGDKRESSYQFWKDILDEFEVNYTEVPSGSVAEKTLFIVYKIEDILCDSLASIMDFVRD